MPLNQRTITLKLTRIEVIDLMIACTAVSEASDADKWNTLHDKLAEYVAALDEKCILEGI